MDLARMSPGMTKTAVRLKNRFLEGHRNDLRMQMLTSGCSCGPDALPLVYLKSQVRPSLAPVLPGWT